MKIRNLLARVDELLDPLLSIDARNYEHDAWAVRRDALDELNLRGLSGNPVYSDIEKKVKFPSVTRDEDLPQMRKLVRGYCSPGLRFLRRQLELAAKLLSQRRRPKHRPKVGFRLSPKEANSRGRARTVAQIIERLRPFKPTSDGQDYQPLQQQDPGFVAALEKVWTRPKLEAELTEAKSDRAKKQMAMRFAQHYHEKELSTIKTDWRDHKPKRHRRKHQSP